MTHRYPSSSIGVVGGPSGSGSSSVDFERTFFARKKPRWRASERYFQVWTASTSCTVSRELSRFMSPACFHCGSDCIAGNPKWYVNLCFLRFANVIRVNAERREGHSYIEPSCIASHIYLRLATILGPKSMRLTVWAHRSRTSVRSSFL